MKKVQLKSSLEKLRRATNDNISSKPPRQSRARYFMWAIQSDYMVMPDHQRVFWIGVRRWDAMLAAFRPVFRKGQRRLFTLFDEGLKLFEVDAGQVAQILSFEATGISNVHDVRRRCEGEEIYREYWKTLINNDELNLRLYGRKKSCKSK